MSRPTTWSPPARRTRSGSSSTSRSPTPGSTPADHVKLDERYLRPAEVDHLVGDPSKAKAELGWEPEVSFRELVELMVDADVERLSRAPPPASPLTLAARVLEPPAATRVAEARSDRSAGVSTRPVVSARMRIAKRYLSGDGHRDRRAAQPAARAPIGARVRYVDRLPVSELRAPVPGARAASRSSTSTSSTTGSGSRRFPTPAWTSSSPTTSSSTAQDPIGTLVNASASCDPAASSTSPFPTSATRSTAIAR